MVNDASRPSLADPATVMAGIADVAREHLQWTAPLSRDLRLVEAMDLDSLRQLTLVVEIENRFRIRLDGQDERSIQTVGDLVDLIQRKLAEADADDDVPPGSAP
jgi:acyl carrier protein